MRGFGKRGSGAGDVVEMIPVLVMLAVIAVVVFGISVKYYDYDISVRDAEARLVGISIEECLSESGVLNLDEISESAVDEVLVYCGIKGENRVYVGVEVLDSSGDNVASFSEGDSGSLWVRELFDRAAATGNVVSGLNSKSVEKIVKYKPGYFEFEHPVVVFREGNDFDGVLKVEVLVNYE